MPAAEARIDLVDRIFTRIGASDDLARGQSTFMVEMTETANILNNATRAQPDHAGRNRPRHQHVRRPVAWRGPSSSICTIRSARRRLFATHYHELTELAARLPRLKNFNVAVREWHDQIVFLRKIVEGGTDKSYGIQVARLAGVPEGSSGTRQADSRQPGRIRTDAGRQRARSPRRQQDRDKLKKLAPPPQMDLFGG